MAVAGDRGDAPDRGPGADVMDEDQRGALPHPADASLVRPRLVPLRGLRGARSVIPGCFHQVGRQVVQLDMTALGHPD
jgi:hypothetical protein